MGLTLRDIEKRLVDGGYESTDECLRFLLHDIRREIGEQDTTVAELVALLRMGRDLVEAAGDVTVLEYRCLKASAEDAKRDRDRILGLYDAAIAEHGGEA